MSISIYKKENQADGNFNYGEILEKKPIGFPQDGGKLKPYSNLFYWAHAWTPGTKSTIGLHCLLYTSPSPTRQEAISYAVFCLKKKK